MKQKAAEVFSKCQKIIIQIIKSTPLCAQKCTQVFLATAGAKKGLQIMSCKMQVERNWVNSHMVPKVPNFCCLKKSFHTQL